MNFYQKHILPKVINFACSTGQMKKVRARTIPMASGEVLEIGFGSGLNLPFYQAGNVKRFVAVEPDPGMRKLAAKRMVEADFDCEVLGLKAETIPLDDGCMDTVVVTFSLCSIADTAQAMAEIRRVIKPDGRLIFAEHGLAPDERIAKWQRRIEPFWKPVGGGCHLTRKPVEIIAGAGFSPEQVEADYLPKIPKFSGYVSFGHARPA